MIVFDLLYLGYLSQITPRGLTYEEKHNMQSFIEDNEYWIGTDCINIVNPNASFDTFKVKFVDYLIQNQRLNLFNNCDFSEFVIRE